MGTTRYWNSVNKILELPIENSGQKAKRLLLIIIYGEE